MEGLSLITLTQWLLVFILALVSLNLYLVVRLKDLDPFRRWNANFLNPFLFMVFLIGGLIAAFWSSSAWSEHFILVNNAASEHGKEIDRMFWNTMIVTILVVVITNTLLFYYSWRYRTRPGNKALFYPHNNRLEMVWTIIPAIVLTLLIFDGVTTWHGIMGDPPEEALEVEVNGKQFGWTVRYPGEDAEFGYTHVSYINEIEGNVLGFNWEDTPGHDDLVTQEMHLPVGVPVNMVIRSRDVLHSATIAHFRVKMDAVPGMQTNFWFTPSKTTAQMREETGNSEFDYEMSCQQICGGGHWNMRLVIVVETMEEYQEWLKEQRPYYAVWKEINGLTDETVAEEEPVENGASDSETMTTVY